MNDDISTHQAAEVSEHQHPFFVIERVSVTYRTRHGITHAMRTDSSFVLFRLLRSLANGADEVIALSTERGDADADSVAALNCFLRASRAMGRMHHPWDRLAHMGFDTKYEWRELCEHLALNFR